MSGNVALPGMLHAGVKAAPSKKKGGPKRRKALLERGRFWAEIQKNKVMEDLFKKYDVSNTGFLDPAECKKFLQDAAKGQEPTDEEVQFVIKATHEKENREGAGLTMSEMSVALDVWRTWEQVKPEMAMYMQKYDSNASGKLEMDQLKELLKDLNEGLMPTDEEAQWVMDTSDGKLEGVEATGGVNITELHGAIVLWYTHVEEEADTAGTPSAPSAAKAEGGSACCVVC
jgi:Ca2+-binding EF-hand superfamily protein